MVGDAGRISLLLIANAHIRSSWVHALLVLFELVRNSRLGKLSGIAVEPDIPVAISV